MASPQRKALCMPSLNFRAFDSLTRNPIRRSHSSVVLHTFHGETCFPRLSPWQVSPIRDPFSTAVLRIFRNILSETHFPQQSFQSFTQSCIEDDLLATDAATHEAVHFPQAIALNVADTHLAFMQDRSTKHIPQKRMTERR